MRFIFSILAAFGCMAMAVLPAQAEGFGTPVVDGVLDGVYGIAEASDPAGDGNGNANMDLLEFYVVNDNTFWYFYFTVNADIGATIWGKYVIYIDTTNDANGATSDAWGRNVTVNDPHKPEFGIYSWVDNAPYGTEDIQFHAWTGGAWSNIGTISEAALTGGPPGAIEWKVAKAALGSPSTIWCEVWCTGGGTTDNAQDTINDPADDWNAVDWSTTSVLVNSTEVAEAAGGDVIPPTVVSAKALGQSPISEIEVIFSEPVDQTTAETTTNYAVAPGITVNTATLQADPTTVILGVSPDLVMGDCYSVTVINVEDLAGNPIDDNGTTNIDCFKLFELRINALMNLHLRDHTYDPEPDTVAVEGGLSPFTWDPTCDHLLADAEGDSSYTGTFQFCLDCDCGTGEIAPGSALEFKFTHQCDEWESTGNHYYEFQNEVAVDTLDIWWNDEAPVDFTLQDVDVIWFVSTLGVDPMPVDGVDTLGVVGSQLPLTWDVPPVNELRDNGEAPDETAGDGIWSARLTFPAGSLKNVYYKFTLNSVFECDGQDNRYVFLDDELYSSVDPLIMPLLVYDRCDASSVEPIPVTTRLSLAIQPNPAAAQTTISFVTGAQAEGQVAVYDLGGRVVRLIASGAFVEGPHQYEFDGRDQAGNVLANGVYFVRVQLGDQFGTRPIMLLK